MKSQDTVRRISATLFEEIGAPTHLEYKCSKMEWQTSPPTSKLETKLKFSLHIEGPSVSLMELASKVESFIELVKARARAANRPTFLDNSDGTAVFHVGETRISITMSGATTTKDRELNSLLAVLLSECQKRRQRTI